MPGYNDIHLLKTIYKHMLLNSNIFTSDAVHSTFVLLKVVANFKIKTKAQRFLCSKRPRIPVSRITLNPREEGPLT